MPKPILLGITLYLLCSWASQYTSFYAYLMTSLLSNSCFEKAHSFPCPASLSTARSCWILEVFVDCSQQVLPKGITKMWNDFLLEEKNMSNKDWIPKATSIELFFILQEMFNWKGKGSEVAVWSLDYFFSDVQTLNDEIRTQIYRMNAVLVILGRWDDTNCNVRGSQDTFSWLLWCLSFPSC